MPCAIVVPNSPIFSPSKIPSIFCRPSPSPRSSPRVVLIHGPPPPTSSSRSSSLSSSPKAFPARFQQTQQQQRHVVVSNCKKEASGLGLALKRKRPMRIDIPTAPVGFAAADEGDERVEAVEVDEDGYSVYCKRGKRGLMEDRYSAVVDLRDRSRQAFFGVFDGHGGSKAAEFAAKNLDKNIVDRLGSGEGDEKIMEAVKGGYLATDVEFLKEDVSGGACCVTALIQEGNLVVSNAGDCRAVMSRGGVAEALTFDHHPCRTDEKARIENSGGYVDCYRGVWRIQGSLAVSRGIGDRQLKQWVIAEPETTILPINPKCEFLMLASDGLWDKVTNQEAVDVVRPLCVGINKPELFSACKKLVNLSISRGSMDDTSVMIIQLGRFAS